MRSGARSTWRQAHVPAVLLRHVDDEHTDQITDGHLAGERLAAGLHQRGRRSEVVTRIGVHDRRRQVERGTRTVDDRHGEPQRRAADLTRHGGLTRDRFDRVELRRDAVRRLRRGRMRARPVLRWAGRGAGGRARHAGLRLDVTGVGGLRRPRASRPPGRPWRRRPTGTPWPGTRSAWPHRQGRRPTRHHQQHDDQHDRDEPGTPTPVRRIPRPNARGEEPSRRSCTFRRPPERPGRRSRQV